MSKVHHFLKSEVYILTNAINSFAQTDTMMWNKRQHYRECLCVYHADNVAYIAHYVSHVQQGVNAAVNAGDMTVFSLHIDSFNAMFLQHGGNVIHVMSVK